jgi:hypothetical protein
MNVTVERAAYVFARGIDYFGGALFLGGLAFLALLWPAGAAARGARRVVVIGWLLGLVGTVAAIGLEGVWVSDRPFGDVFSNPTTFLAVSQAFEDTGVRAYKGGAATLAANVTVLEAALQIHAIEARHASKVRRLRGEKGWVSGAGTTNVPTQAQAVYGAGSPAADYPAESNTTHAGVNVANLAGVGGQIGATAASESFDEPLDMATVNAIAGLFIQA